MRPTRFHSLAILALIALLAGAPEASARSSASQRPASTVITGTLSKPGYTVIALGYNGRAAKSKATHFQIKSPDSRVTLQLLTRKGKYAGPVLVGGSGTRVIEGVKAGAQLGTIKVLNGYAVLARKLPAKFLDAGRWAQARKGVPLGNGRNFGLVRSKIHNGPSGAGGDSSRTGVPNALSIDPAGDGVIAALRPAHRVHGPLATDPSPTGKSAPAFSFFSQIFLPLDQTLNADASGVTTADIDAMLPKNLNIVGINVPGGDQVALDCGGLSYCSPGGTGEILPGYVGNTPFSPFPSCCNPSGDGFGVLRGSGEVGLGGDNNPNNWGFFYPRATSSQIGSGDAFVLRVTSGDQLTQTPVTLAFVFDTVPALSSYDDGAGHSGQVTYPAGAGDAGTQNNPIPVAAGANGDVVLKLIAWRPQRAGIAGAGEASFMDIGHLNYYIDPTSLAQNADAQPGTPPSPGHHYSSNCSAASLSTSDPNLSPAPQGAPGMGQLVDGSSDQPARPANQLTFTVDLTKCLTDAGASGFPVGAQGAIGLGAQAPNSGDHAVQNIWVRRAG